MLQIMRCILPFAHVAMIAPTHTVLVGTLRAHGLTPGSDTSADVAQHACGAMRNLAKDSAANRTRLIRAGSADGKLS